MHRLQWDGSFTDAEANWNVHAYIIRSFVFLSWLLLFSVDEQCLTKMTICTDKLLVGRSFWVVKCMTFKWMSGKKIMHINSVNQKKKQLNHKIFSHFADINSELALWMPLNSQKLAMTKSFSQISCQWMIKQKLVWLVKMPDHCPRIIFSPETIRCQWVKQLLSSNMSNFQMYMYLALPFPFYSSFCYVLLCVWHNRPIWLTHCCTQFKSPGV